MISNLVIDLISSGAHLQTSESVGLRFFDDLRSYGATAINARGYPSKQDVTDPGIILARLAPDSFMPVYEEPRFYAFNPLPLEAQRRSRPFAWSEIDWHGEGARWVRDTMSDCGCPDGLIVPCHGPNGYLGVVSLAFERLNDLAPADRNAIELASHFLHGRMKELARPRGAKAPSLTPRERDCLLFVSEGRSDKEIALQLGVSAATVAFHVLNARAKLGARTRAQAVAAFLASALL